MPAYPFFAVSVNPLRSREEDALVIFNASPVYTEQSRSAQSTLSPVMTSPQTGCIQVGVHDPPMTILSNVGVTIGL